MGSPLIDEYINILKTLHSYNNIPQNLINSLQSYCMLIYRADQQNRFDEPMPWIGIYISLASLLCILAMVADLLHGLQNRKFWFPCKYFTLNATSLTMVAIAMKLPVDLNNPMPGTVDQAAKLGSMAFMCTMMANLLPSLATMENKELVTNIVALGILVITLVVNVGIQIKTGLVSYTEVWQPNVITPVLHATSRYSRATIFSYLVMLLFLLAIHISSALTILTSKRILELKYQAGHESALKDLKLQQPGRLLTVEKLKKHVRNCWIMAATGSPQFVTACSAASSASGVICVSSAVLQVSIVLSTYGSLTRYTSDYKWSMSVILIIQFIGVLVGTIAPLSRCFAALSFKLSGKWIWNHIKVFKVESYWTQKLHDFKESSMPIPFSSRKCKIVFQNLKVVFLSLCIGFQKAIVVTCKTIGLIPIFFVISIFYCLHCWKWLKSLFIVSRNLSAISPEQHDTYTDTSHYVLQVQDDIELAEKTLKGILNSVNLLIQKSEKQQPNNLIKFITGSRGFEGVEMFDSYRVPPLLSDEPLNCWSLPLVTLTSIAISLPNIQDNIIDSLLRSVSEGLVYVTLMEESLNATDDFIIIHKAAKTLWLEVEVYQKWLGNRLEKIVPQVQTTGDILKWFQYTAKNMVMEIKSKHMSGVKENAFSKLICANSMYRITQTILLYYHDNVEQVSQQQLFAQLSSMIVDIMSACFTNLPRVIEMKCNSSAIEKREASVQSAAQLLGETMPIINTLQYRELPRLNPDELPFIDKWHAYLKHPFP